MSSAEGRGAGRGLQFEIVASLFVVVLAGLSVVAVVLGSTTARVVEDEALERMRIGTRHLVRMFAGEAAGLGDLAALVHVLGSRALGGEFLVLDERGVLVRNVPASDRPGDGFEELLEDARQHGEVVQRGAVFFGDLVVVVHLRSPGRPSGFLVGRVPREDLIERVRPLLLSGAWVLVIGAAVFVVFGTFLLRRRIVDRIHALLRATERIASGDLSSRVGESGADEISVLGASFDRMAEALERERDALLRAKESLSRSERLATVGQLAAGVAHEVGNPAAAILTYSEVLQRESGLSPRGGDVAGRIRAEALRIRDLIREFLDLARPESIRLERMNPSDLVDHVVNRLAGQARLDGIALVVALPPDLPTIAIDRLRAEQILVNLIENAADAIRVGSGRHVEIRGRRISAGARLERRRSDPEGTDYSAHRAPDAVAIDVVDDGPGIPAETLQRIFDPFYTTKTAGSGTGLGLWNAHRFAEILGGRIEVKSEPGCTSFSLILPVADRSAEHGGPTDPDHR